MNKRIAFVSGIVLFAVLTRFIPHPPNFTALAAVALFGGAYLSNRFLAFVVPFAALLLSDLFIGFHDTMWAVYLSFGLTVLMGMGLGRKVTILNTIGSSVVSSILFFVITNFAVWLNGGFYPMNMVGLAECYAAAIPFFRYGLLGDLFFTSLLFGGFYLAGLKFPELAKNKIKP